MSEAGGYRVALTREGRVLDRRELSAGRLTIGRDGDFDLVLHDLPRSFGSAGIEARADGPWLSTSSRLVFVGGPGENRPDGDVNDSLRLLGGDEIEIGPYVLAVEHEAPSDDATEVLREPTPAAAAVPSAQASSRYVLRLPGGEGLELRAGTHVIGRSSVSDVVLNSDVVSKRHAILTITASGATVRDLGSTNGTFVNGKPAATDTPLQPGDQLVVGEIPVTFEDAGATTAPAPPGTMPSLTGSDYFLDNTAPDPRDEFAGTSAPSRGASARGPSRVLLIAFFAILLVILAFLLLLL